MNVLAAVAVLGLLIIVHEAGHFFAATCQGIRVNGFSIGFGPALIKRQRRGVTYAIRALPLGGFVSFPEDGDESGIAKDDPDLSQNRPLPQRAFVIAAGVIANLLLAWIVLVGQVSISGLPEDPAPGVMVVAIQSGEAASQAGLAPGDQILGINGQKFGAGQDAVETMVALIKAAPEQPLQLQRKRANELGEVTLMPADRQGEGRIGAQLQANVSGKTRPANNPLEVISKASAEFSNLLRGTVKGYAGLVTDFGSTAKQMGGPVKIVEMGSQLANQGGSGLAMFTALISINLGVLNALPIPLLDGWQMLMLIVEGIRGKPIPERFQLAFMQSGFLLFIGLSILLIVRDTTQLTLFQQLFGR